MQCLPTLSTANFAHSMFVLLYSCHHVAHRFYYRTFFDVSKSNSGARGFRVSFTRKKGQQKEEGKPRQSKSWTQKTNDTTKEANSNKIDRRTTIAIHRNKLKLKHLTADRQRKCDGTHTISANFLANILRKKFPFKLILTTTAFGLSWKCCTFANHWFSHSFYWMPTMLCT